jgi:hypothetical protein
MVSDDEFKAKAKEVIERFIKFKWPSTGTH